MEGARRPYARSLSKEQPGLKKQRLSAAALNSSDGRPGANRQARAHVDRDSNSSDSLLGEHQELVSQYKFALSELTFNSKPIITNLSIIAGENLHAAKAIAATVCAHIIEVAPDRKLPSLYLLDSIVKNIGKDYIKHFSSRLPEVFCTAYWQVDPSTHQGMRHLFGTWKGVFPPQVLQTIEKDLGFTSTSNGSSSGVSVSRENSQVQRPGHSIHVNPKYLERQQLQTSRARGSGSDISGSMVSSPKIADAPRTTIGSKKSWADPFVKTQIHPRDQTTELVHNKFSTMESMDTDYDSIIPGLSGMETGRVNERFKEQGLNKSWHGYGRSVSGHPSDQKNRAGKKTGLEGYAAQKSTNHDLRLQGGQFFSVRNANDISQNWKNSEEEEYSWDGMNSKPTLAKDNWVSENDDRLEVDIQYQEPRNLHDMVSRIDDEPSVDSAPHELTEVPFSSWPEELHPPDMASRTPYRSQQSKPPLRGQSVKFPENKTQGIKPQMQAHGTAPSTMNSSIRRMSSPSLSESKPLQPPSTKRNEMSTGRPIDPRRPTLQRGQASRDQSSLQRLQPSASLPPPQQKKYIPPQQGKVGVAELEPYGVQHSPVRSSPRSLLNARTKDQVFGLDSSIKPSFQEGGSQPTPGVAQSSPNATNSATNPFSSLLSSLVAKGLIGASSSDKLSSDQTPKPIHLADIASRATHVGSISASSPPLAKGKSPSVTDEQSSFEPADKPSSVSPQSKKEMKSSIGFEFRPDVMRKFHPDLVADLVSDLPHICNICGAKLKFQELLDRHMEWHASRVSERDTTADKISRKWYSSLLDWVMGPTNLDDDAMGATDEALESCEKPMVTADESQCACILCGELFEDFYNVDGNEWMFKGAVYLDISSSELRETLESNAAHNLIVHSHCVSEEALQALGLGANVQQMRKTDMWFR